MREYVLLVVLIVVGLAVIYVGSGGSFDMASGRMIASPARGVHKSLQ